MGYLLLKNPARVHSFDLAFGKAHVFYPELSDAKSAACLLIDIDPVGLVRGRSQSVGECTLDQYVTDRPYVSSSFLSVALPRRRSFHPRAVRTARLRSESRAAPAR